MGYLRLALVVILRYNYPDAWAGQDENSTATPQARQTTAQWAVVCRAVSNLQECLPRLCEPDSLRERVRVRFLFTGGFEKGLLGP